MTRIKLLWHMATIPKLMWIKLISSCVQYHTNYHKIDWGTLLGDSTQVYFMCINYIWLLLTVANMTHSPPRISLQTYKHDIMGIHATFWHWDKLYFSAPSLYRDWSLYQIRIKTTYSYRYHNKPTFIFKLTSIITQIWYFFFRTKCTSCDDVVHLVHDYYNNYDQHLSILLGYITPNITFMTKWPYIHPNLESRQLLCYMLTTKYE